ncbi:MAG: SEC-C domain-containing protein [Gammaproteobacteria bacterium]|nr:SEC-C domain-containing protein [Gammaproteobacteria bacterium]
MARTWRTSHNGEPPQWLSVRVQHGALIQPPKARMLGAHIAPIHEGPPGMSKKIGRNDPCPCGSGLKYKRCCASNGNTIGGRDDQSNDLSPEIQAMIDELKTRDYASLEEAQAAAQLAMRSHASNPIDDFVGLTLNQMHGVLYRPFDSPDLLTWPDPLGVSPDGEAIELACGLAEALGSEGVKRTAKDNLPRQLCRELLARWQRIDGEDRHFAPETLQSELDYGLLHRVRLTMEFGGLIRKYRGRFLLTRNGRDRFERHGAAGLYPALLRAYVGKLNWGYDDGMPEVPMLQHSFLFTLHLFGQLGDTWRPTTFYADALLRAFPPLILDFVDDRFFTAEEKFYRAYALRTLTRFAAPFGLIEFAPQDADDFRSPRQVRRRPLLEEVVQFR